MHIEIIAVGQKMPDWVNRGYADYAARFAGDLSLGLTEIPLQKRTNASQLAATQNKEAAQIRSALQTSDYTITLDIPGREHSSAESWSLGKLTLPHPLVRIIVAEALYRAWSINRNHPYHRA